MKFFQLMTLLSVVTIAACCLPTRSQSFAEKFQQIEVHQTRAEVTEILGPAATVTNADFPEGHFMGPQAGMTNVIEPGQPYEQWEYVAAGEIYLVFFAGDESAPVNQWNVVGKTHYPKGAVF